MTIQPDEQGVRARADLVAAIVLVALGLAVFYMSWTMPRLEARRINPATIPGLVPMILGAVLTLLGGLLAWRSWRIEAPDGWRGLAQLLVSWQAFRVGAVLGLALVFTLVLVGWLPFWLAAMLFIFTFIILFETVLADQPIPLLRSALWALGVAVVAGGGIAYAFTRIFLIRLP
ncbi:tripartite tricarboxylate transporter TctB family protein [Devosia sp. A449]